MKKKKIIIFISLVLIIFIIVFVINIKMKKTDDKWNNQTEIQNKIWSWEKLITVDSIIKDWDISNVYCEAIKDEEKKKECISKMEEITKKDREIFKEATESLNKNLCNDMVDISEKEACLKEIKVIWWFNEAVRSLDLKECDKIEKEDLKQNCINIVSDWLIFQEAVKTKNLKKCNNIKSEWIKDSCIKNIKFQGFMEEAIQKRDVKICDKITDDKYKETCINEIEAIDISLNANKNLDVDKCKEIKDSKLQEKCKEEVNNQKIITEAKLLNDIKLCEKINVDETKEVCKRMVKETKKDDPNSIKEEFCNKYEDNDKKYFCKARLVSNYNYCDYINQKDLKDKCLLIKKEAEIYKKISEWAKKKNDSSLCEEYKDSTEKQMCIDLVNDTYYYFQALEKSDVSLCDNYIKKEFVPLCKATVSKDKSYCDKIEDEINKQRCLNRLK